MITFACGARKWTGERKRVQSRVIDQSDDVGTHKVRHIINYGLLSVGVLHLPHLHGL